MAPEEVVRAVLLSQEPVVSDEGDTIGVGISEDVPLFIAGIMTYSSNNEGRRCVFVCLIAAFQRSMLDRGRPRELLRVEVVDVKSAS